MEYSLNMEELREAVRDWLAMKGYPTGPHTELRLLIGRNGDRLRHDGAALVDVKPEGGK